MALQYLHEAATKCKPLEVDPFFTKTGSKVGLAWQRNDSKEMRNRGAFGKGPEWRLGSDIKHLR